MSNKKVLVDTSVWIEFFRGRSGPAVSHLEELINSGRVCISKIVLAELWRGARTPNELKTIDGLSETITKLDESDDTWKKAAVLARNLDRKGYKVSLTDAYLAELAQENSAEVLSLDKHFEIIKRHSS